MQNTTPNMNWFKHYTNAGFSVLPIRADGSKAPAIPSWAQYQLQAPSEAVCDEWNEQGFGVGLIGGRVSGGLEIVDIDSPELARPFFKAVKDADPLLLEQLAFVATPRRDEQDRSGVHVYYRCPLPEGNQKLAMTEPIPVMEGGRQKLNPVTGEPVSKPETLIETRGEGGYVLTVGSPAVCHPTYNTYEHKYGCQIVDLEPITDEQRTLLFRIAASFDRSIVETYEHHTQEHGEETPGNRFAAATAWEDILFPHGWTKCGNVGDVVHWRRPGKTRGTSATTGLQSSNGTELLCVFSSNAHPFPGADCSHKCSTHSKFDAYARLNFDGNYSACAKHLAGEGYGTKVKTTKESRPPITFQTWDRITLDFLERLEAGADQTIDTGIWAIDTAIGGLAFGEVCIIGGRPSHGKTLLALQMTDYFSQCGYSPLVFSEEMGDMMLAKRRLQMLCDTKQPDWQSQVDSLRTEYRSHATKRSPVYIAPKCGRIDKMIEVIEEAATKHELNMIVIDYAQLVRGKGESRYEQVTDVSQKIREVTSKYQLLTLLLCQLNRGNEKTNDRPRSTDLRDSGQLEQDADTILLVDWPARRDPKFSNRYEYHIWVEKNRNRKIDIVGEISLVIDPERQTIKEPSREWEFAATAFGGESDDFEA